MWIISPIVRAGSFPQISATRQSLFRSSGSNGRLRGRGKKHEIYVTTFGSHLFYDLFLQGGVGRGHILLAPSPIRYCFRSREMLQSITSQEIMKIIICHSKVRLTKLKAWSSRIDQVTSHQLHHFK